MRYTVFEATQQGGSLTSSVNALGGNSNPPKSNDKGGKAYERL